MEVEAETEAAIIGRWAFFSPEPWGLHRKYGREGGKGAENLN
jgi:hypothetical protein